MRNIIIIIVKVALRVFGMAWSIWSHCKLRMLGVSVGRNVKVFRPPIVFRNLKASIEIGDRVKLYSSVYENKICGCTALVLAADAPGAVIIVGNDTGISCSTLYAAKSIQIGKYVNIGAGCKIFDTDFHPINIESRRKHALSEIASEPIVIEDDVWLGGGVTVLKGVRIGRGAIIAAGAVVTSDIPPFTLAAGVPARVIRQLLSP